MLSWTTAINPGTSDFWLSVWIKSDDQEAYRTIVYFGGGGGTKEGVALWITSSGELDFLMRDDTVGNVTGTVADAAIDNGNWHHVTINADRSGNATCYIDGILQTAVVDISSLVDASISAEQACLIGSYDSGVYPFHGDLSKIAYGTGLLTTTEIAELYNSGNGITRAMYSAGLAAKTVHSWNCNEAPEATLYDSTNENHGTPSLPGTELVTNGGFEDRTGDNFDDWSEDSIGSGSITADTDVYNDASPSCKITTGDDLDIRVINETGSITAGSRYRLVLYVRDDESHRARYGVFAAGAQEWIVANKTNVPYSTGDFTEHSLEFTAPAGTTTLVLYLYGPVFTGASVYLDDVSVVRTGPHVGSTAGPEATNVTDSVGSNNGLAVNMDVANVSNDIPTALAGTGIKSLSFDGVEELVEVANDDSLRIADTVTLSCWFKTTDDTSRMTLLTKRYNEYELAIESNNKALAWYGDAGGYDDLVRDSIPAYANGAWHHVTAAIDKANGTLDVVFDGVAQTQVTGGVDRSGTQGTNVLTVGMRSGVSNEFTGSLCDCRVYNKLLSTAESQSLAAGTDVTDGLVSRWKFDDQWSTSASNGDTIASWTCKATGSVFAQETAAFRPVYRASGIGGSGAIELDGVDDFLELSSAILGGDSGAVFYVAAFDAGAAGCSLLSQADAASEDNHLSFGINSGSSIFLDSKDAGTRHYVLGGSSVDDGTARVVACVSNGTSWSLFVNNVELSPLTVGTSNSGKWFGDISLCDALTVGRKSSSSPAGNFDGKVAEIIAYEGTVSEDERSRLSKRLAAQYGIAL
jgi:hypothetical protein